MKYLLLILLFSLPFKHLSSQCDSTLISFASDHDNYAGQFDTLCIGDCQRYWIKDSNCTNIGYKFYWFFAGSTSTDTLMGDTVSVCFNDTGMLDIYYFSTIRCDCFTNT